MAERLSVFIGRRFFAAGQRSRLASLISLLAMVGLVMGVSLLIVVLSVMNGFDREMRTRILGLVPHLQLYQSGGVDNWVAVQRELARFPGIAEVTPFTRFNGMISVRGEVEAVEILGIDPANTDSRLAAAVSPSLVAELPRSGLLFSELLAERLGVVAGDTLTVIIPRTDDRGRQLSPVARAFTLAGTFDTHTAEDNSLVLAHLGAASAITGLGDLPQGLRLRLDDVFAARDLGYRLIGILPTDFSFVDWFQTHGNLYQAIQLSRQLEGLLVFLIIAIAVFNVISMLVMTVVDKKGAIAILKTQGAANRTILGIFLVQGTLIGIWGCLLGTLLGVPAALYVSDVVSGLESLLGLQFLSSEIYPIDYLPSDLQWGDVGLIVAVALGLNFVATLYPAWSAARVRPAEVLRYE